MEKHLRVVTTCCIITTIISALTIAGAIVLNHFFPEVITVNWAVAICVAIVLPSFVANVIAFFSAHPNLTDAQKKAARKNFYLTILSLWYIDFVYICSFLGWTILYFVLSILYLTKTIYDVTRILIKRNSSSSYPVWVIVADYVVDFLMIGFLIYKIPDESLQTIFTALAAAALGGLLTLLGVVLTIKRSDSDRKNDRLSQIRPFFFYTPYYSGPDTNNKKETHPKSFGGDHQGHFLDLGRFVNSDKVEFLLRGIKIEGKYYPCDFDSAVSKGELFQIELWVKEPIEVPKTYLLLVEDVDKNPLTVRITLEEGDCENTVKNIEFLKREG